MAKLKPWYQLVIPREDLRENRPMDASEFAVHLDQLRDNIGPADFINPDRFFERTYLTKSLLDLSSQVVRRLSGIKVETSAVFNMATQFGGGKTHGLTTLYHLARGGSLAQTWRGVDTILKRAGVKTVPQASVAVFVGTEVDVLTGRGGSGEPVRKTPWGEIAWQLGGEKSFAVVAEHDARGVAPAADVIRKMLPEGPCLILLDELMNYVSRARKIGLSDQLYNFIHSLSEEARGQDRLVLCVSIPASELEMNPEDQRDYDSYKKMLDRVGRAISMTSDAEVTEIIRRRLFDWCGLSSDMRTGIAAYAEWAREHPTELGPFATEATPELFQACYPFHPSAISVFERKWQSLPRFQRTRGVLRLLALWIARAYQEEHRKASSEPLIMLGAAPFDDQIFRDAVFEQLGSDQLSIPVSTDIAGKKESHARRLDAEANESIRKSNLHQKVATVIFMESNGGQSQRKAEASLSEIRAAVGGPTVNLAEIETVLEGLTGSCYYLETEQNRYRFGLRPNLNQVLNTRRAAITSKAIDQRVRKVTEDLFKAGPRLMDRRFFPDRSNDIPDRAELTLAVLGYDRPAGDADTLPFLKTLVENCGGKGRTFKSCVFFAVPDAGDGATLTARDVLTWEEIAADQDTVDRLEEAQKRTLKQSLERARKDLHETVFRSYRHVYLLNKTGELKDADLGQINSSMAGSLPELVVNSLRKNDEIVDSVSVQRLLRFWPPALNEWPTRSVSEAFFSSPALPRLANPESIKQTISDGISGKQIGYGRKTGAKFSLEYFGEVVAPRDIEISEDAFIIKADEAQKLLEPARLDRLVISPERAKIKPGEQVKFSLKGFDQYDEPFPIASAAWTAEGCEVTATGLVTAGPTPGQFTVVARCEDLETEAGLHIVQPAVQGGDKGKEDDDNNDEGIKPETERSRKLRWKGELPILKWTNFYMKMFTPYAQAGGVKIRLEIELPANGTEQQISSQRDKVKAALRELGLADDVTVE